MQIVCKQKCKQFFCLELETHPHSLFFTDSAGVTMKVERSSKLESGALEVQTGPNSRDPMPCFIARFEMFALKCAGRIQGWRPENPERSPDVWTGFCLEIGPDLSRILETVWSGFSGILPDLSGNQLPQLESGPDHQTDSGLESRVVKSPLRGHGCMQNILKFRHVKLKARIQLQKTLRSRTHPDTPNRP